MLVNSRTKGPLRAEATGREAGRPVRGVFSTTEIPPNPGVRVGTQPRFRACQRKHETATDICVSDNRAAFRTDLH